MWSWKWHDDDMSLSLYVWKVNISPTWQNGTNKFERYYFVYPKNVWNFLIWPENYLDRTLSHSLCVALWFTSAKWWLTTNLSPAQVHRTHAHTQQIASRRNDDLPAHHSSESLLEKSEWVSEWVNWLCGGCTGMFIMNLTIISLLAHTVHHFLFMWLMELMIKCARLFASKNECQNVCAHSIS